VRSKALAVQSNALSELSQLFFRCLRCKAAWISKPAACAIYAPLF